MQVVVINNRDNSSISYEMPTKYVNQSVLSAECYKYITEKVNEFWDKDMSFTIQITRTYEEGDIFGYPKH